MRTVTVAEFGPPTALEITETPTPEPGPEDVVVRVAAAGTSSPPWARRPARRDTSIQLMPADRYGLGWDVAGVVEAVGADVSSYAIGERVLGLRDVLGLPGTHAPPCCSAAH